MFVCKWEGLGIGYSTYLASKMRKHFCSHENSEGLATLYCSADLGFRMVAVMNTEYLILNCKLRGVTMVPEAFLEKLEPMHLAW